MFRRLPKSLPPDVVRPTTLEQMGYFMNEDGQIRMMHDSKSKYHFRIHRNDRVNEVHQAAMHDCIRTVLRQRFLDLGLEVHRLPTNAKDHERHVPIYISRGAESKKRMTVIFGARNVDPGIFSFHSIADDGIESGSAIPLIICLTRADESATDQNLLGLIIANPCQLTWYRKEGRAVGDKEWMNLPRRSAVHEPFGIDPIENKIPGNGNYTEHVQYMFENILNGPRFKNATFDIIGIEFTGMAVMQYVAGHWDKWSQRINGVCLGNPQHTSEELTAMSGNNVLFSNFLRKRVRGYIVSDAPLGTLISVDGREGCNCYASGEHFYEDGILAKAWKSMLDWFGLISTLPDYEEPVFSTMENNKVEEMSLGSNIGPVVETGQTG